MNVNIKGACPTCDGFGLQENPDFDCLKCYGAGTVAEAVQSRVEKFIKQGYRYDDPIFQLVANLIYKD